MSNGTTALDLYVALATVAAITTGLQASAASVPVTQADRLERRKQGTQPSTLEREAVKKDAKRAKSAALWLVIPSALVNLAVLIPWADITFRRMRVDWILILPWSAVSAAWLALTIVAASAIVRIRSVHGQ